jgi:hypothetical protein
MYRCVLVLVVAALSAGTAWADEITDWNQTMLRAALIGGTSPPATTRVAAVVQAAVFDAANGIARRYTPIHVEPAGPAGASQDAAAVQAAYAALVQLYPAQKSTFDARLAVSLAVLGAREDGAAIASGRAWGQTVADAILAWRSTDGFTPAPDSLPRRNGRGSVATHTTRVRIRRRTSVRLHDALGDRRSFAIPTRWSTRVVERSVCPGLQRNEDDGQYVEHHSDARSDGVCLVLGLGEPEFSL